MRRTLPGLLIWIAFTSMPVRASPTHKTFHVATSANPVVIAILADHYTDAARFESHVENFITYGLMAHPYYAAHSSDLQIETFYEAVPSNVKSNYGFDVDAPSQNCLLSWEIGTTQAANTSMKIAAAVGSVNPRHTIVIGDHPYSMGCTEGEWTYVGEDATGTDILPHELGHGIGQLHDEWWLAPNAGLPHPGMSADPEIARNCHHRNAGTTPTPPWTFPGAGSYPGCDLYGADIVHPYNHLTVYGTHRYCLMGATSNAEFCPVCKHYMDQEFAYIENPDIDNPDREHPDPENPDTHNPDPRVQRGPAPPTQLRIVPAAFTLQPKPDPPQPPVPVLRPGASGPIVRMLVAIDPAGRIEARRAYPVTARYAPNQRRLGEFAYEVLSGTQVLGVGVVPASVFRAKNYQGGAGHLTSPPQPAEITIQMPGVTSDMLKDPARQLSIRVWWLSPNVRDKVITSAVLDRLKSDKQAEQRGVLTPEQIRSAI
jgi:hypothetical protein